MKDVRFKTQRPYDDGWKPSVAINKHGLAVETHRAQHNHRLYTKVGRYNAGTGWVAWDASQHHDRGHDPSIALNDDNHLVRIHHAWGSWQLWYEMGTVNTEHQRVDWKGGIRLVNNGATPSIALNNKKQVVTAYQSHGNLIYHAGAVNPDERSIRWTGRIQYDAGHDPSIALNDAGVVVEAHRGAGGAIHYRVGTFRPDRIDWGERRTFPSTGLEPSITLTEDNYVVVVYKDTQANTISSRVGRVNVADKTITFADAHQFADGRQASVAIANNVAIETHVFDESIINELRYTCALLTEKTNYHAAAGMDEPTFNGLSKTLYESLYPRIFKGTIKTGFRAIPEIEYDAQTAPVFDFRPSEMAIRFLKESIQQTYVAEMNGVEETEEHEAMLSSLLNYVDESAVTFGLKIEKLPLVLVYQSGNRLELNTAIEAGCQAVVEDDKVVPKILTAKISIPERPNLEGMVNKYLVPRLIKELNKLLKKGMALPSLEFQGVKLTPPAPRIENKTLLAYAAIQGTGGIILPREGTTWPSGKVFLLIDEDALEKAGEHTIKDLRASDRAEETIRLPPFPPLKLTAAYEVGLKDLAFRLVEGPLNAAAITAYAGGKLTAQLGDLPRVELELGAKARPEVEGNALISNNRLEVRFVEVRNVTVAPRIPGWPWAEALLRAVLSFLATVIGRTIGGFLRGKVLPVYPLPRISFTVEGLRLTISLQNQDILTVMDAGGKKVLAVAADVAITPGKTAQRKARRRKQLQQV